MCDDVVCDDVVCVCVGMDRESRTMWVGDIHNNSNDVIRRIQTRAQSLLKHPSELMEPLQVVRYPTRGHFNFHYGSYFFEFCEIFDDLEWKDSDTMGKSNANPYFQGGGNRLATLLIILKQSSQGGQTAFPLARGAPLNDPKLWNPLVSFSIFLFFFW